MQLYFIRHAQSENNALWTRTRSSDGRSSDPLLTDLGHRQAQYLGGFLAGEDEPRSGAPPAEKATAFDLHNRSGFHFTHLYCSLMLRAVETGLYLARALDLPLVAWKDVHERGGVYLDDPESGEAVGLPGPNRAFFEETYPELVLPDSLDDQGWWGERPYETVEKVPERASRFLTELAARHGQDDRVAVISHGGFFQTLLQVLAGFTPYHDRLGRPVELWLAINNVSISRFDFAPERIRVAYLNRVDFLPRALIS